MAGPSLTGGLTIRDLLAHRSGLPPANLMWLTSVVDPDTLLHRLRWIEPAAAFRSAFTYQNLPAERHVGTYASRTLGELRIVTTD